MRHKMNEYKEIRHHYINDCRAEYGHGPRAKAIALSSTNSAGLTAALFGCLATIVIFATFDPHGFQLLLWSISDFSPVHFLENVFSPLRGLFLDPWGKIF